MWKLVTFVAVLAFADAQSPAPFLPRAAAFNPAYAASVPFAPALPYNTPYTPTLDYSNELNLDGSYRYSFLTADGKHAEEAGYLKDVRIDQNGEPVGTQVVQGSYSYTAPDGTPIQVSYIADENGFQPTSIRVPLNGNNVINPAAALTARYNPLSAAYRNPYALPLLGRYPNQLVNDRTYLTPK